MKAHIPLSHAKRQEIKREAKLLVEQEWEKQVATTERRILKLDLLTLNELYGAGTKRMSDFIIKRGEIAKEFDDDEIFWEHVDRILIDRYGLPLERDYTD